MNKYLHHFLIVLILLLSPLASALAAEVSFKAPERVYVGEVFEVLVNFDSDEVMINSVDFSIAFNQYMLEFSGYKSDDGVVKLWVTSPILENGVLNMSGIIPGGVSGLYDPREKGLQSVPVVSLMFTAKKTGNAEFSFIDSKIFKHDGKGTEIDHEQSGASVVILDNSNSQPGPTADSNVVDAEKPEPFEVVFLDSAFFGRTPSMIIFETTDKISGIKEFRVKGIGDTWLTVKSPYPVSKGLFPRNVSVRAYDFYDNFQESSVTIPGMVGSKFFWGFVVLLLFCLGVYKVLKYKA